MLHSGGNEYTVPYKFLKTSVNRDQHCDLNKIQNVRLTAQTGIPTHSIPTTNDIHEVFVLMNC